MNSVILRTSTRLMLPVLLMFSLLLLLLGHNEPGGGFAGGLVAASAFALYSMARDAAAARRLLRVPPIRLIGAGLAVAAASGCVGLVRGKPLMTPSWAEWSVPVLGTVKVGTPLVFDIGVYLTVLGVTLMMVFAMREE